MVDDVSKCSRRHPRFFSSWMLLHFNPLDGDRSMSLPKMMHGGMIQQRTHTPNHRHCRSRDTDTTPPAQKSTFNHTLQNTTTTISLNHSRCQDYECVVIDWLSRDPIDEKDGLNPYEFVNNGSPNGFDFLGTTDFEWREPQVQEYPLTDRFKPREETFWTSFRSQAAVYHHYDCCYNVELIGGYAQSRIEYIAGAVWEDDALEHKWAHVSSHFKEDYKDYISAAKELGKPCMSKTRANCIMNVLMRELASQYELRSLADGSLFDYWEYGWRCRPSPDFRKYTDGAIECYEATKTATVKTISVCGDYLTF